MEAQKVQLVQPPSRPSEKSLAARFAHFASQPVSKTDEIETKVLVKNGFRSFADIKKRIRQCGAGVTPVWNKRLFTAYLDTPEQQIHKNRKCLRQRYECDDDGFSPRHCDISSKDFGTRVAHGLKRLELEARIKDGPKIDMEPLFARYADDQQALSYLKDLVEIYENNPQALREIVTVQCDRQSINVAVYIAENENGEKVFFFRKGLPASMKDARHAVFEFSLDHCLYRIPVGDTGENLIVGEDYEVEFEYKIEACEYSPHQDVASHESIDMHDLLLAQEHIVSHIVKAAIPDEALDWSCPSKQVRAYDYRAAYETKSGNVALPSVPTVNGMVVPCAERKRKAATIHILEPK